MLQNSDSLNCVREKRMRMFSIFHKLEEFFIFLKKDVVNIGGGTKEKLTIWLLLSFNVIFTLLALHKFKSLEKCESYTRMLII